MSIKDYDLLRDKEKEFIDNYIKSRLRKDYIYEHRFFLINYSIDEYSYNTEIKHVVEEIQNFSTYDKKPYLKQEQEYDIVVDYPILRLYIRSDIIDSKIMKEIDENLYKLALVELSDLNINQKYLETAIKKQESFINQKFKNVIREKKIKKLL